MVDNYYEREKLNRNVIKCYTLKFDVDSVRKIIVNNDNKVQVLIESLLKAKKI